MLGFGLVDLEPQWVAIVPNGIAKPTSLNNAQGIRFLCPQCKLNLERGKQDSIHSIIVWFANRNVPNNYAHGGTYRWTIVKGNTYSNLTLSPSVWLKDPQGCQYHGFITDGFVSIINPQLP